MGDISHGWECIPGGLESDEEYFGIEPDRVEALFDVVPVDSESESEGEGDAEQGGAEDMPNGFCGAPPASALQSSVWQPERTPPKIAVLSSKRYLTDRERRIGTWILLVSAAVSLGTLLPCCFQAARPLSFAEATLHDPAPVRLELALPAVRRTHFGKQRRVGALRSARNVTDTPAHVAGAQRQTSFATCNHTAADSSGPLRTKPLTDIRSTDFSELTFANAAAQLLRTRLLAELLSRSMPSTPLLSFNASRTAFMAPLFSASRAKPAQALPVLRDSDNQTLSVAVPQPGPRVGRAYPHFLRSITQQRLGSSAQRTSRARSLLARDSARLDKQARLLVPGPRSLVQKPCRKVANVTQTLWPAASKWLVLSNVGRTSTHDESTSKLPRMTTTWSQHLLPPHAIVQQWRALTWQQRWLPRWPQLIPQTVPFGGVSVLGRMERLLWSAEPPSHALFRLSSGTSTSVASRPAATNTTSSAWASDATNATSSELKYTSVALARRLRRRRARQGRSSTTNVRLPAITMKRLPSPAPSVIMHAPIAGLPHLQLQAPTVQQLISPSHPIVAANKRFNSTAYGAAKRSYFADRHKASVNATVAPWEQRTKESSCAEPSRLFTLDTVAGQSRIVVVPLSVLLEAEGNTPRISLGRVLKLKPASSILPPRSAADNCSRVSVTSAPVLATALKADTRGSLHDLFLQRVLQHMQQRPLQPMTAMVAQPALPRPPLRALKILAAAQRRASFSPKAVALARAAGPSSLATLRPPRTAQRLAALIAFKRHLRQVTATIHPASLRIQIHLPQTNATMPRASRWGVQRSVASPSPTTPSAGALVPRSDVFSSRQMLREVSMDLGELPIELQMRFLSRFVKHLRMLDVRGKACKSVLLDVRQTEDSVAPVLQLMLPAGPIVLPQEVVKVLLMWGRQPTSSEPRLL